MGIRSETLFEQKTSVFRPNAIALGTLKAITNSKIHQNLLKYWFTLRHFAMDDPVVVLEKKKKKIKAE